jgi:hypothetical protein
MAGSSDLQFCVLLGFDHTQLTYRYGGRDFRLTGVHGNVVNGFSLKGDSHVISPVTTRVPTIIDTGHSDFNLKQSRRCAGRPSCASCASCASCD